MKLAVITPNPTDLCEHRLSYHMVLAQEALRHPAYARWYYEASKRGDFIILDNGTAEGDAVTIDQLIEAANLVRADEIAMPDVLEDSEATIALHMDKHTRTLIPAKRRMIIPQGKDEDEWLSCCETLIENCPAATIGVPKHTERFVGGRSKLIGSISHGREHNIHALGCYGNPIDEVWALTVCTNNVRGIDTGAPIAHAQHMEQLCYYTEHRSLGWDVHYNKYVAFLNIKDLWEVCCAHNYQ